MVAVAKGAGTLLAAGSGGGRVDGEGAVPTSGFLLPHAHVPPAARGQPGALEATRALRLAGARLRCSLWLLTAPAGSSGWRKAGTVTKAQGRSGAQSC